MNLNRLQNYRIHKCDKCARGTNYAIYKKYKFLIFTYLPIRLFKFHGLNIAICCSKDIFTSQIY